MANKPEGSLLNEKDYFKGKRDLFSVLWVGYLIAVLIVKIVFFSKNLNPDSSSIYTNQGVYSGENIYYTVVFLLQIPLSIYICSWWAKFKGLNSKLMFAGIVPFLCFIFMALMRDKKPVKV